VPSYKDPSDISGGGRTPYRPFLGSDLKLGPTPDPNITGNRSYTRANFLYYAGVVTPGLYR
jgi:hypothetical protein